MDEVQVFNFGHIHDKRLVTESFRATEFYSADHLRMPFRSVLFWYDVTLQHTVREADDPPDWVPPVHRYVTIAIDTDAWGLTPPLSRGLLVCDWIDHVSDEGMRTRLQLPSGCRKAFLLAAAGHFKLLPGLHRWHGKLMYPPLPTKDMQSDTLGGLGDGVLGLSMVMCTKGVPTRVEEASTKLNAKRVRNGKEPLVRVTHVDTQAYYQALENTAKGGTHASPVPHLRRGHIRHYANGSTVWIRDCLVNCRSAAEAAARDHYEVER